MYVLTSETCRAVNNEIIKQVTSSWSLFIQVLVLIFWFWIWGAFSEAQDQKKKSDIIKKGVLFRKKMCNKL